MRHSLFLFLCMTGLSRLCAQHLTGAERVHLPDSGVLTAGALDAAGNLYLASTLNLKTLPGLNGLAGLFPAGDPVLSKFAADGTLLWRREFPGNVARICDAAITPDQHLVITGGYADSFRLAPNWVVPGTGDDNASFFVAELDPDGDFLWMDTDVSTLPEDCIGWTLAVTEGAIYVAGIQEAIQASLRRYGFDGTLQAEKIVNIRSISDLVSDGQGNLYAAGTASPGALFGNLPVPEPALVTGYANYIARLDSDLNTVWIRATNYITFDEHPRVAVLGGRAFLLSNDFDQGQNQFGVYRLKAYGADGDLMWSDPVLGGFFPADYQHFVVQPYCDRLLLEFPSAGGMVFRTYAADSGADLVLQSSTGNFEASFPFLCTEGDRAVFGSNFRNAELSLGGDFTLHNDKTPGYQQFILQFQCADTMTSEIVAPLSSPDSWLLAPNPATAEAYVYYRGEAAPENARAELFDALGRRCWQGRLYAGKTPIPVAALPTGAYFLRITAARTPVVLRGLRQ